MYKQSPDHIAKRFASRSKTMLERAPERIWAYVDKRGPDECWNWTGPKRCGGYGYTELAGEKYQAHRLIFNLVNPGVINPRGDRFNSKSQQCLLHNCDNPSCCNPAHLRVGTLNDNVQDKIVRNRMPKWEAAKHPLCKLTMEQIKEIRSQRASGITGRAVARIFGVSPQTISSIMVGRYYQDA